MSAGARIVVGIDSWGSSDDALDWAADEARAAGRPLHVLHAPAWADAGPITEPEPCDPLVAKAVASVHARYPELPVTGETTTGSAAGALVRASVGAHLVVIGAHPEGPWASALWASLRQRVPIHACCPVVVVPPGRRARPTEDQAVLVGLDGSRGSQEALLFALERASWTGQTVRAVHCVPGAVGRVAPVGTPVGPTRVVRLAGPVAVVGVVPVAATVGAQEQALVDVAIAAAHLQWAGVHLEEQTVTGSAAESLLRLSATAALLVVGSRGLGGFAGLLLGSVASRLVSHPGCPLVVVGEHARPD